MSKMFEIELVAVEPFEDRGVPSYRGTKLTFRVKRHPEAISFLVPLLVTKEYDDADMVRVARTYMHNTFKKLAEETAEWDQTPEELELLSQAKKNR